MKARLKIIFELVYELDPRFYAEGASYQQMLDADIAKTDEDPSIIIENMDNWEVSGELI